jgi:hypothetical protein
MHPSLIPAMMQLGLVRLLRGAMRPKLPPAPALPGPAPSTPPPLHRSSDDRIEHRPRIEPAPRFEPRPVHRPAPRVMPAPPAPAADPHAPCPQAPRRCAGSPLLPPWKTMPWEKPADPPPPIKIIIHRPDITTRGMLIDFYR